MAASPRFKVFRNGEYVASCKYAEDAAVLVSAFGDGSEIRDGHTFVVWREGFESQSAGDSYDHVGIVISERIDAATAGAWWKHTVTP